MFQKPLLPISNIQIYNPPWQSYQGSFLLRKLIYTYQISFKGEASK